MRCNIIHPTMLTDQHLIAEKRELRMIPPLLEKRVKSGKDIRAGIPARYTLGSGHMLFWLDKMRYLSNRYDSLVEEMRRRGFQANPHLTFDLSYATMYGMDGDWTPTQDDYTIILERIKEKIYQKPGFYRFCGKRVCDVDGWISKMYSIPYCEDKHEQLDDFYWQSNTD